MREILFRAKEKKTGKWVYGSVVKISDFDYRIVEDDDIKWAYTSHGEYEGTMTEVESETICQYIGLCDKNGRKIFENDIVEIPVENGYFLVEWSETEARWQMNNEEDRLIVDFDNYWSYQVEVIGNVFDNPEILEVN